MHSTWYYNLNAKPQGPFQREEFIRLINRGEIRPETLVLNEAESSEWLPAKDFFKKDWHLFPAFQLCDPQDSEKHWVLMVKSDSGVEQKGPFALHELRSSLSAHELEFSFCWKPGLTGWAQVLDRPELK